MEIRIEEFEDKGEKDAEGFYDYYYKGKHFYFEDDAIRVAVRTYADTSNEASFLSINDRPFNAETIGHPILKQIEAYLRNAGFTKFKVLYGKSGEYESLPIDH